MPDVGILQLQIQDNSKQAASGLRSLSRALDAVKKSVSGGLRLSGVATQVEKLSKAVSSGITPDLTNKINMLADAVRNLREASAGFEMPNLRGVGGRGRGKSGGDSFGDAERAMRQVRESIDEAQSGFHDVESVVEETTGKVGDLNNAINETNQLVQSTAWQAGGATEALNEALDAWIRFRAAHSLGAGDQQEIPINLPGFIYAEGTVTGDEDIGHITGAFEEVAEKADEARKSVDGFAQAANGAWKVRMRFNPATGAFDLPYTPEDQQRRAKENWEKAAEDYRTRVEKIKELFADADDKAKQYFAKMYGFDASEFGAQPGGEQPMQTGEEYIDNLLNNASKIDVVGMKMEALRQKMVDGVNSGKMNATQIASSIQQYRKLETEFDKLKEAEERAKEATDGVKDSMDGLEGASGSVSGFASKVREEFEDLKEGIKRFAPGLSNLGNSFMRIAKYRFIRAIIKEISDGFREGVENVYHYSKAIGSGFATSMDDAASSLLMMKNALGASIAPLIQSLIPYLQAVVGWFINIINYLNQFLSLLRGQATWTRPIKASANAFDDVASSAHGASAAMKDLLADWDELNIIQSENSGGGGGSGLGAMEDYLHMFEETSRYERWLKDLADGIEDTFGNIWNLVKWIGVALLGWKFANAFTGVLGMIGGLVAAGAIIGLTFNLSTLFDNKYLETGETGWLVADVLTTALGTFLAGKVVGKILGGEAATIAMSLTLAVSALADIKALLGSTDTTALSKESLLMSLKSSLKLGTGFFLLAKKAGVAAGTSALASGGVAAVTFGAVIGIKAVVGAVDTGEVTTENVTGVVASAVSTGLGVGLFAAARGVGAAAAIAAGGYATLATGLVFGAALGVVALVNMSKENIEWGNEKLTDEEVQSFVNGRMFTVDVEPIISVVTDRIQVAESDRTEIANKLASSLGTFNVIKLGLASKEDYSSMRKEIIGDEESGDTGLVGLIDQYVQEAKDSGKLTLQFTPTLVGGGEKEQAEWFSHNKSGWDTVNDWARTTGNQIGTLLHKGEIDALDEGEPELLKTLMDQMSNVTRAITNAEISGGAFADLQINLGDLSQASFDDIITQFTAYRQQLEDGYSALVKEQYTKQKELVAALYEIDPNSEAYKQAVADLAMMEANLQYAVEDSVRQAAEPGVSWLTEFLLDKYSNVLSRIGTDWWADRGNFNPFSGMFDDVDMDNLDAKGISKEIAEWLYGEVYDANQELGKYVKMAGLNPAQFLVDDDRKILEEFLTDIFGKDNAKEIMKNLLPGMWDQIEEEFNNPETVELTGDDNFSLTFGDVDTPEFDYEVDTGDFGGAFLPAIDTSKLTDSIEDAKVAIKNTVDGIFKELYRLKGISLNFDLTTWGRHDNTGGGYTHGTAEMRAGGGFVRSGDLVMANENGNFEMMGRMGNQPVVANNQQIVDGISSGVAQANGGLDARMSNIETLLNRILQKEFTAKAVPDSSWGRHAARSAEQYSKVTG